MTTRRKNAGAPGWTYVLGALVGAIGLIWTVVSFLVTRHDANARSPSATAVLAPAAADNAAAARLPGTAASESQDAVALDPHTKAINIAGNSNAVGPNAAAAPAASPVAAPPAGTLDQTATARGGGNAINIVGSGNAVDTGSSR